MLARYLRLLRSNRNFRLLWLAQIISELGDWFYSLAVYSLLLELTGGKAAAVGLAVVLQVLPSTFAAPTAGGDARPLGNAQGRIRAWTRDGRYLLVWLSGGNQAPSIGVLDLSTKKSTQTIASKQNLANPRLSPDNRWVAFQVLTAQQGTIWVAPFHGDQPVAESEWIRIAPGVVPIWSPDSRTLYYARYMEGTADATVVMRQPLGATGHPAGPATQFYRFEGNLDSPIVNTPVASRSYLYTLQKTGMSEIWMMDLQ